MFEKQYLQDINMRGNKFKNAGFEIVTSLPETYLFAGRTVIYQGVKYTYNGNLWTSQLNPVPKYDNNIDGINTPIDILNARSFEVEITNSGQIFQLISLLKNNSISLTNHILQDSQYIYERMNNGTTEWVETTNKTLHLGDKLRFTAWKDYENNPRGLASHDPGSVQLIYISSSIQKKIKTKVTIEYLTYTNTLGDADVNNSANYSWWTVYQKELTLCPYWILPLQRFIYYDSREGGTEGQWYITNVRVTFECVAVESGTYNYDNVNEVYIYTTKQITPINVPININYNAKIKPTQTTTTYKTNSWILQYLTQSVNWLCDNIPTQRCSTQENQTIINNYLNANNIPFSTNKDTGEVLYNAQDLLASIISKIK